MRILPVLALLLLAACADDAPASVRAQTTSTATSATPAAVHAAAAAADVVFPDIEIPDGILAAMPFQNRQDVPAHLFQIEIRNHGQEALKVVGVQLQWAGFSSALATRDDTVVPGEIIDFPVPFTGATCSGDGTLATMPDLARATVRLVLADGSERSVPVFDHEHFAARLYLDDCRRQRVESLVDLAWTGLRQATFEGRPVTEGALSVTRRVATGPVSVTGISNTINFSVDLEGATPGHLLVLPAGTDQASLPVRIVEGRCDYHAVSESSQPFNFVVHLDFGDAIDVPYILTPAPSDQGPMTTTVLAGCDALGKLKTLGPQQG